MRSKSNISLIKLCLLLLIMVTAFSCVSISFAKGAIAQAEDYYDVQRVYNYGDSESTAQNSGVVQNAGTFKYNQICNNVLFVGFADEEEDLNTLNMYRSITESFETYFNTGDYSVKNYYTLNSNGKLDVQTPIIKDQNSNLKIFTTSKPRSYYLPYIKLENGSYSKNSDGYFEYYLVQSSSSPTTSYNASFFDDCQLIAKVYERQGTIGEDTDLSDGIISRSYANQLRSNNSNYYLVKSNERFFREYEFMCDIMSQAGPYMDSLIADQNNDGILDCLSMILLDGQMASGYYAIPQTTIYKTQYNSYYYGELLWSHKVGIKFMYENFAVREPSKKEHYIEAFQTNMKYSQEDAIRIVNYLYSMPLTNTGFEFDTVSISNSNLTQVQTQDDWNVFVTGNSTFCHEFGHILGLPDLYYGSGTTDCVGCWSQMCGNPAKNSFFTSYEREKLGWLTSDNVHEITKGGVYELKAVHGNEGNNVVAFKVKDPTNRRRYLYLEYRRVDGDYFDTQAGNKSGLLLYAVDTTRSEIGNINGRPYEINVQRKSGCNVGDAVLQTEESFGSNKSDSNAIKFDSTYSTFIVTVMLIDNDNLMFFIEGGDLETVDMPYALKDFDNNSVLYKKLLDNLAEDQLYLSRDSFVGMQSLDLSCCEITDLTFLTKFDLSTIKYINLAHNSITSSNITSIMRNSNFTTYISNDTLKKVILTGNNINLDNLTPSYLNNAVLHYGVQFVNFNKFSTTSTTIMYYLNDNSCVDLKLNNNRLALSTANVVSKYIVEQPNLYTLVEDIIYDGNTQQFETQFNIVSITSKYPNSSSKCIILQNSTPSNNAEYWLNIEGVSTDELEFSFVLPNTTYKISGNFTITVKYNGNNICQCSVYYQIYAVPTVIFKNGSDLYIEESAEYIEQGLIVYEDSIRVDYQQSTSGEARTYYVEGYYKGAVLNQTTNEVDYSNSTKYNTLNTSIRGRYLVRYILCDANMLVFEYYNYVTVTAGLIDKSEFDLIIYNTLTNLTGKNAIAKDDFYDYDYINLVGIGATSIRGLKLLELKSNAVIDLSNNTLNDIDEVTEFIAEQPYVVTILIANKFSSQDINGLSLVQRDKVVFGVQNCKQVTLTTNINKNAYADYYNDYANYYSMPSQLKFEQNIAYINDFGQFNLNFICLIGQNQFIKPFTFVGIVQRNNNITHEYSDSFNPFFLRHFAVVGVESSSISADNNADEIDFTTLGEKTVIYTVTYLTEQLEVSLDVTVVDTKAPVIRYTGVLNVYVTSYADYLSNYSEFTVTAVDGYDGSVDVHYEGSVEEDFGEYTIEYTATDSSNNSMILTRKVFIGKCELSSNNDVIDINNYFNIPITFTTFKIEDFNIFYMLSTDESYSVYDYKTGIICNQYGSVDYIFELAHKYNIDITYNFEYHATASDISAPTITLNGSDIVSLYVHTNYVDSGIIVTDNSTTEVVGLDSSSENIMVSVSYIFKARNNEQVTAESIDSSKIGTYIITYTATDRAHNTSIKQRMVNVIYYPVDVMEIKIDGNTVDENSELNCKAGSPINLTLGTNKQAEVDPNSLVIWYVNDEKYATTNGFTTSFVFKKSGTFIVKAVLADNPEVSTQEIKIVVHSNFDYSVPILIVVLISLITYAIVFATTKKKKQRFYKDV